MKKNNKPSILQNSILLIIFLGIFAYISIKYTPEVTRIISKPDQFKNLINSYGSLGILIYILFMISHVVIVFIPGELIQIAGGYIYGIIEGTAYSVIGLVLGTIIVFYSCRIVGFRLVKIFVPEKKIEQFSFLINSRKAEIVMFLLFLIPGVPKDALIYIASLTPIKPLRFIIISLVARFPGVLGSSIIGANIQKRDYLLVIILLALACILFIAGLLLRDKIINRLSHHESKGLMERKE